ncbi:MAG TPA: YihY/virulence factor BrkB family protein [Polyangiaceae bacterium]|nr:YihY/virulence factor BrkB family protein [Polyangiaceae bacterium]
MPSVRAILHGAKATLTEAWIAFSSRGGRILSAALAYYAILSLGPVFLLALKFASLFTDAHTARDTLLEHVARWVGPSGADTVGKLLVSVRKSGLGANALGLLVLVYGATRLFSNLSRAIDMLWGTATRVERTWSARVKRFALSRVAGVSFVLGVGILLVGLAFAHGIIAAARELSPVEVPLAARVTEAAISFGATTLIFTAIFKVLPTAKVPLTDAAIGGAITAALFTLGSLLVTAYVAHKATSSTSAWGQAASVVLLLLWCHYSAHAFFFGAAITGVHARRRGALDVTEAKRG